jgi:F0F1-type ATP synthase assembly protein I
MKRLLSLRGRFDLRLLIIFAAGICLRTLYAVIAPLSEDWRTWYLAGITVYHQPAFYHTFEELGVYSIPPYVFALFYALWLTLAVPHPDPAGIVTFPNIGGASPYFQPSMGAFAFVLVMKLPSLISDTVIAALIYKMLFDLGTSRNRRHFAVSAWLLNPLTMVMSNYNGVDPMAIMLVVASAYFAGRNRYSGASFSLIVGGLMRLLPFIALPFLVVKTVRNRDWKGIISTTGPLIAIFLALVVLLRSVALALFQGRPGFYVPEALDVFGSALQLQGTRYPEDVITLVTFAFVIILAITTYPSKENSRAGVLVLAPFLAYTAFAWSWPPLMEYVVPLALIQLAQGRGYKTLTILFTVAGILWSIVQEGKYMCLQGASFFFIPLYDTALQQLNLQCLNAYGIILSSGLSVQIRGTFSALLVLLIVRMIWGIRLGPERGDRC